MAYFDFYIKNPLVIIISYSFIFTISLIFFAKYLYDSGKAFEVFFIPAAIIGFE